MPWVLLERDEPWKIAYTSIPHWIYKVIPHGATVPLYNNLRNIISMMYCALPHLIQTLVIWNIRFQPHNSTTIYQHPTYWICIVVNGLKYHESQMTQLSSDANLWKWQTLVKRTINRNHQFGWTYLRLEHDVAQ